jgi:hypothetical protein
VRRLQFEEKEHTGLQLATAKADIILRDRTAWQRLGEGQLGKEMLEVFARVELTKSQ